MNVLYVIDSLAPGGAERSLVTLVPALVRRDVTAAVAIVHRDRSLAGALTAHGIEIVECGGHGRRRAVRRLRDEVRRRRPDVVHTTLYEADQTGRVAASSCRVPVVSTLANLAYGPEQLRNPALKPWKVRAAQAVDIATSRAVRRFHAVSETVAVTMARRLLVRRDRIDVVPRGRDAVALGARSAARATKTRATLGLAPDAPLLATVARHEYQKGLDVVLDALGHIVAARPDAVLLLVGRTGNETAALEAQITRLGLGSNVRVLGARDDVADILATADAVVVPSRWEGFSNVIVEAMALGAPIVASDIASVREAVDASTAVLVPPDRPAALAAAVEGVLDDRAAAARRAVLAHERFASRYELDAVAAQMLAFYERALGTPISSS